MRISKRTLSAVPLALTLILSLAACEQGLKNPVAPYQHLVDKAIPEHGKSMEGQTYIAREIFNIIPATTTPLTFIEGQDVSQEINLQLFDDRFTADVKAVKLPKNAKLHRDPVFSNKWYIQWTAPAGTIPRELSTLPLDFVLAIDNIVTTDTSVAKVLATIDPNVNLKAWIRRSNEQPTLKVKDLSGNILMERQPFDFDVEVTDPTSSSGNPPTVQAFFPHNDRSQERFEEDFSSRIRLKSSKIKPQQRPDGSWLFKYVIDTNNLPPQMDKTGSKVNFESPTVAGLFALRATGTTGVTSSEAVQRVTAKFASVKPIVTLDRSLRVLRGSNNRWNFQVYTPTQKGIAQLDEAAADASMKKMLNSLGAEANGSVNCDKSPVGPSQTCRLEITVQCGKSPISKKSLSLVANSVLGDNVQNNTMSIGLEFSNSESCNQGAL
jgi:hypothetical protein